LSSYTLFLEDMINDTTLAIISIVAALGLLGLVVVETVSMPQQQAEAISSIGQCASALKNASASFCHRLK
jgi:hypothetical protein